MAKKKTHKKPKNAPRKRPAADWAARYSAPLIIALAIGVWLQALSFDLVYCDDFEIILKNYERIEEFARFDDELFHGYMTTNYYRPLVNLSFWWDAQLGGQNPFFYHATNLLLHIAGALGVWLLLLELGHNRRLALLGGLVWAVHPVFANAIVWLVGRNDLLYTLGLVYSFIALVRFLHERGYLWFGLHLLLFFAAILSKEAALVFPLLFALYIFLFARERIFTKESILLASGWFLAVVLWWIMRSMAVLGDPVYTEFIYFFDNLAVLPEFVAKFLFPANLSVMPTFNIFNKSIGLAFIGLLIYFYIRKKERNTRLLLLGFAWFLLMTLPGMFVKTADAHDWNEYLECRAYMPLVGFLIMFFGLLPKRWLDLQRNNVFYLWIALIIMLAGVSFFESKHYADKFSFYEEAVSDSPGRAKFHTVLGKFYLENEEMHKAERELKAAIESNPGYNKYHYNLGAFYYQAGDYESALRLYKKALGMPGPFPGLYSSLSMVYSSLGRQEDAARVLKEAVAKWPDDDNLKYNLASYYLENGKASQANEIAGILLSNNTKRDDLYALYSHWAKHYYRMQQDRIAAALWHQMTKIDPQNPTPHKNLCLYYIYLEKDKTRAEYYHQAVRRLGGSIEPQHLAALKAMQLDRMRD